MATNGLLTIVKGGKVWAKIVCGCEGHQENVERVAEIIRNRFSAEKNTKTPWKSISATDLREYALEGDMGCLDCLVAIVRLSAKRKCFTTAHSADLNPRYIETFDLPYFNPRWDCGVASGTVLLDLDTMTMTTEFPKDLKQKL